MSYPPNQYDIEKLNKLKALNRHEAERFLHFLETGALYTPFQFAESATINELPQLIELFCPGTCQKEQTFERVPSRAAVNSSDKGWAKSATYQCRNCANRRQSYMYVWQDGTFWKVGQVPELKESVAPELRKALGDYLPFYRKAIRSRNFGFGIGALSYLRRIVEDTTDELMNLLKDEKWESWNEPQKSEFETARTTYQYSRKIQYAAERILPSSAFVDGRDSFTALHDVTSSGLHGKTEEDCIALFDRCNLVFTRTFQILHEHKTERDQFAADLSALKR